MGHPLDLTYRLGADLQAVQFIGILEGVRQAIGFDEETRFDLTLEDQTNQRFEYELAGSDLARQITAAWASWRYLVAANQWIKDMNVKFSLVRRTGGVVMVCKGETESGEQAERVAAFLENRTAEIARAVSGRGPAAGEQAFSAAPLAAAIADEAREYYLQGDYSGALQAAFRTCAARCRRVFPGAGADLSELGSAARRRPPCSISGNDGPAAKAEWAAFAQVLTGTMAWTALRLRKGAKPQLSAGETLRQLALLSAVADRLDECESGAVPARKRVKTAKSKPGVKRPRPVKKTVRKTARGKR